MKKKKLFLFDIDGTIALGDTLIDGTMELLKYILQIGGKYLFITNNSTKGIEDYVKKFEKWNIPVDQSNFITSSYATALYLERNYAGKKIFALGTRSFVKELKAFGLNITEQMEDDISCAVVGFDNELKYNKIELICELLQTRKIDYIATNPDLVCPTPYGFVPDCGAICSMIGFAVKRNPYYVGKPNPEIVEMCLQQTGFKKSETVVVGDRLYTDIACGLNAGVDTALVLTGEAKKEDLKDTEFPPSFCFDNIRMLYESIVREAFSGEDTQK